MSPLRDVPLDPDPLDGLALAMGDLWEGEDLEVVLDLVPITPGAQRRWRNKAIKKHQADPGGSGGGWAEIKRQLREELTKGTKYQSSGRAAPSPRPGSLERRDIAARERQIHQLLSRDEPHFMMQLLLRATSPIPGRPPVILQSALGAFDVFAGGENWLRVKGWRLFGRYLAADAWWNRRSFDARFDAGRVRTPPRNRVGATAIAGLLKPPTKACTADNVIRSEGLLAPPPAHLPTWRRGAALWPLGVVRSRREEDYLAGVPLDDTLFSLTTGSAQYGKTESALGRIMATVDAGHGVMFIDPHGDAVERLKPYLVDKRARVLELALELGLSQQAGWNPFAIWHLRRARGAHDLNHRLAGSGDRLVSRGQQPCPRYHAQCSPHPPRAQPEAPRRHQTHRVPAHHAAGRRGLAERSGPTPHPPDPGLLVPVRLQARRVHPTDVAGRSAPHRPVDLSAARGVGTDLRSARRRWIVGEWCWCGSGAPATSTSCWRRSWSTASSRRC